MLVRLIYASRVSSAVSAEEIREILDSSQRNNPGKGLTGLLCFNANIFVQVLEGPRGEVNALYNRLVADSRHKDVTLLDFAEISMRSYSSWSMGWAGAQQVNRELFLKYSASDRFDPFSMSAEQISGLLLELSQVASAVKSPDLG